MLIVIPGFKGYSIYSLGHYWTFFCVFSLVQVLLTKGCTLGHAVCRMILVSRDGSTATAGQLIKRYFCLWLFMGLPLLLVGWLTSGQSGDIYDILTLLLLLALRTYFVIYFVKEAVLKGERPMAHDRLSGTAYMAVEIPQEDRAEKNKSKKRILFRRTGNES